MIMVNGNTWPFQTVQKRRYRFRFLNGCQSRFLILDFANIPGVDVWQIGNEGGFLAAPVNITADHGNRLLMGLGRARGHHRGLHQRPGRATTSSATSVRTSRSAVASRAPTSPSRTPPPPVRSCVSTSSRRSAPDPTTPPQFLHAAGHRAAPASRPSPAASPSSRRWAWDTTPGEGDVRRPRRSAPRHGRGRPCRRAAVGDRDVSELDQGLVEHEETIDLPDL